jgi:hypothetical protein
MVEEQDAEEDRGRQDRVERAEQEAPEAERLVVRLDRRANRVGARAWRVSPSAAASTSNTPSSCVPSATIRETPWSSITRIKSVRNGRFFTNFARRSLIPLARSSGVAEKTAARMSKRVFPFRTTGAGVGFEGAGAGFEGAGAAG